MKKNEYKIVVDIRCAAWYRFTMKIEADSLKKAKELGKNCMKNTKKEVELEKAEFLPQTMRRLSETQNFCIENHKDLFPRGIGGKDTNYRTYEIVDDLCEEVSNRYEEAIKNSLYISSVNPPLSDSLLGQIKLSIEPTIKTEYLSQYNLLDITGKIHNLSIDKEDLNLLNHLIEKNVETIEIT